MKFISYLVYLFLPLLFLPACSVYKSQGRKQFETDSAAKLTTTSKPRAKSQVGLSTRAFELKSCRNQNKLATWFQAEFPMRTYELITAESDLEIWKNRLEDGSVEIRATQTSETGSTTCIYQFASESVWRAYQEIFLQELSNNMMTAD